MNDVRRFVEAAIAPRADAIDASGTFPRELVTELGAHGWLGAPVSSRFGGGGWDALAIGRLHGEVGRGCGATRSLLTTQAMIAVALERHGGALREHLLPRLARGELVAGFAMSEPAAGSDVEAIATQARPAPGGYVLDGHKRWVSFGQIADVFLVFARCERVMTAFVLDSNTPGLRRTPVTGLLGLRGSALADLALDGCFIPGTHRLGGGDFPLSPVAATALDVGRYSVAWGAVGLMEACLAATVRHAGERRQFGQPLLDHPLVARRVSDGIAESRAAHLLCEEAARHRQAGAPEALVATLVAKYFATRAASRVAESAVQIHGAIGCVTGSAVERHFRDAKVLEIIEGSTELMQILIARYGAPEHAPEP